MLISLCLVLTTCEKKREYSRASSARSIRLEIKATRLCISIQSEFLCCDACLEEVRSSVSMCMCAEHVGSGAFVSAETSVIDCFRTDLYVYVRHIVPFDGYGHPHTHMNTHTRALPARWNAREKAYTNMHEDKMINYSKKICIKLNNNTWLKYKIIKRGRGKKKKRTQFWFRLKNLCIIYSCFTINFSHIIWKTLILFRGNCFHLHSLKMLW